LLELFRHELAGAVDALLGDPELASAAEAARWLRRAKVVDDPTVVVDLIEEGKIDPESIDALRSVYPALYNHMRGQLVEKLAELAEQGKALDYSERIGLGMLFDVPTDPMLTSPILAALTTAQMSTVQEGAQRAPDRGTPAKRGESLQTVSESNDVKGN